MVWFPFALPQAATRSMPVVRAARRIVEAAPARFFLSSPPAWRGALVLALISTALKLLVVLAPSAHLSPGWVLPEEIHRGNIALELLQGPLLSLQDYHHAPNVGGSIVVGVLAAPLIALLGPSIVAVRLVPILFNALTVALVFLLLDRTYGRRAAWVGGALMAVASPGYTLLSVTAWGTHHENNALSLACVLLALGLRRGAAGASRKDLVRAWSLGLVAGFAVYFGYMSALVLGCLAAFAFLHDKLFFLRKTAWAAAAGAALGFLPWVTYNRAHEFRGLQIYGTPMQEHVGTGGLGAALAHLGQLLRVQIPGSFYIRGLPDIADRAAEWAIYAAFALLVAAAVFGLRRPIREALRSLTRMRAPRPLSVGVLFLIYLPVFALALVSFDVGQWNAGWGIAHDARYLAPLYPFAALLAAVGFETLARRGAVPRRVAWTAVSLVIALCAAGTLAVCDFGRFGESLSQPGTSTTELARFLTWKYRTDVPRLERIVTGLEARRPREVEDQVLFGLSQGLRSNVLCAQTGDPSFAAELPKLSATLAFLRQRVAKEYRPYFELPRAGDRIYASTERAEFWDDYRERLVHEGTETALGSIEPRDP